jgi:hypothetical protein
MDHSDIISKLGQHRHVFSALLGEMSAEEVRWRPLPGKWCILEIVCHLYDEEREDFRARVSHTLENPEQPLTKIDPQGWVTERKYIERDYGKMVDSFLEERSASVAWLKSLEAPRWKNAHVHHKFGEMTAEMFLANWLAHDYLHFRQLTYTKYHYLKSNFNTRYDYAGDW